MTTELRHDGEYSYTYDAQSIIMRINFNLQYSMVGVTIFAFLIVLFHMPSTSLIFNFHPATDDAILMAIVGGVFTCLAILGLSFAMLQWTMDMIVINSCGVKEVTWHKETIMGADQIKTFGVLYDVVIPGYKKGSRAESVIYFSDVEMDEDTIRYIVTKCPRGAPKITKIIIKQRESAEWVFEHVKKIMATNGITPVDTTE